MPIVSDWSKIRLAMRCDFEPIRDVHSYFSYLYPVYSLSCYVQSQMSTLAMQYIWVRCRNGESNPFMTELSKKNCLRMLKES